MMSDQQKELLALLAEIWELSPDVRMGQLFAHLGFLGENYLDRSLGYIDDDELLSVLYRHRGELRARLEGLPDQAPPTEGAVPSTESSKVAAAASAGKH